jgi:hypothetical protein
VNPYILNVQSPPLGLPRDAMVSSLLDPVSGRWYEALIWANFSVEEAEAICRLVPSPLGNPDKRVWVASPIDFFTVKSAYHAEMSRRAQSRRECSVFQEKKDIWQAIWNLKAPASTKNFVWKMCSNILPTKDFLYKKHILPDPICSLCQMCSEDAWHALWTCPASMAIWQECPRPLQKMALWEVMGLTYFPSSRTGYKMKTYY